MWTCQNCGYTDETGDTIEEEFDTESGESVRYCPECGSDEIFDLSDDEDLEDDFFGSDEEED